jgi:hypothetical protein
VRVTKAKRKGDAAVCRWFYLVMSHCDNKQILKEKSRTIFKIINIMTHPCQAINLSIPATPRYRYAVCSGVPKSTTVPIPLLPILETPWVYPHP